MRTLIAAALLAAAPAAAQEAVLVDQSATAAGPIVAVEEKEVEGPVRVDRVTRRVTIKDELGRDMTFRMAPEMLDFDRLRDGSKVKFRYVPPVALSISRPGTAIVGAGDTVRIPLKNSGGETVARARTTTGTIEEIDRDRGIMSLKPQNGRAMTVWVPQELAEFDRVAKGETVVVRHSEAAALSAENKDPEAPVRPRP